ncbi:MAG: glycosyltransferase family 4 protein [Candidatus Blackburnbacteria bacterium]|nr:glycosyltransferase family 4 protein [Candidatus Blackburnbacteria bacterium]
MAKIGIDARIWGVKNTGIGRYTEELVKNLQLVDEANEYVVFCRRSNYDEIPICSGWKKVIADIPHYTLQEQVELPGIFARERLDLLHVPHFNVPLFYKGRFIVTIHDILWHHTKDHTATTLSAPVYLVKHLGYRLVVRNAVTRARNIIVPSNVVKKDLVRQFDLPKNKVVVTHEGVTNAVLSMKYIESSALVRYGIEKPYLLYVGNLYPHKNIEMLVPALKRYHDSNHDIKLVVVSGRDIFKENSEKIIHKEKMEGNVKILHKVNDEDLAILYKNAVAFVFPTLSEGFGLPGLEAMNCGTPVLCSSIPVLKEIYGDAALYFDPLDVNDIADKIMRIFADGELRRCLVRLGKQQVKKYSWRKMASATLAVYKGVLAQ